MLRSSNSSAEKKRKKINMGLKPGDKVKFLETEKLTLSMKDSILRGPGMSNYKRRLGKIFTFDGHSPNHDTCNFMVSHGTETYTTWEEVLEKLG